MIYDIEGHINHVLESPFTCFDWERSKKFMGKSLKNIFSVGNLTINDFYKNRRSIKSYLSDLEEGVITYRKYQFEKNKINLTKKKKKIFNKYYKVEYSYHIFKFLISNYYKLIFQKNVKINNQIFKKLFLDITNYDYKLYKNYLILKKLKLEQSLIKNYELNISYDILKFIDYFYKRINYIKKQSTKIFYLRHARTKYSKKIFIGQKLNPKIEPTFDKSKFKYIKYDYCYSSELKRSIQTSSLFCCNLISTNNLLNEIDYGDAEGLNYEKLSKQFPYIIKNWKRHIDISFPNGENNTDLLNRLNKFNLSLINKFKKNKNLKILVITHNIILRALVGSFFNIPIHNWFKININYLESIETIILNNKIILNIPRTKILENL